MTPATKGAFDWYQFWKRWTLKIRNLCLIDSPVPKTASLAGLLNRLLQKGEGLADFGDILDFICRTIKQGEFARVATVIGNFTLGCQAPDSSSCYSTGNLVFARINVKPAAVLKNFHDLIENCVFVSAKSTVFRIW